jgi:hypothetical protein
MIRSTVQFGFAVILACAALALASSVWSTITTFTGAGAGCTSLTLDGSIPAASVSRSPPPRLRRVDG